MDLLWILGAAIITLACVSYAYTRYTPTVSKSLQSETTRRSVASGLSEPTRSRRYVEEATRSEIDWLKELHFKLHHLERYHEDILPQVRPVLWDMISDALDDAMLRAHNGILNLELYSRQSLEQFLQREYDGCMQSWEEYNLRRQAGGERERFKSREDACLSIRRLAPLRLVDGAWLSHVHKISTPIVLRKTTLSLWQILSEELGDGDLCKNHVQVYNELVHGTSEDVHPLPHSPSFSDPRHNMDDVSVWKAAVAQQLISLLPEDFLPEVLGFNLHFESVALETLIASHELEELGYDPRYYLLHVAIDNPHSGHSSIAVESVSEYLACVERESGKEELQIAWNRVRAGYILSEYLIASTNPPLHQAAVYLNNIEETVIHIFAGKARAGQKLHCGSRIKVNGRTLNYWLDKERFRERLWQAQFLQALGGTRSLVNRGHSTESKLIKDMCWGGKMFGSFTNVEVKAVKRWIDTLPPKQGKSYWHFTGLSAGEVIRDQRTVWEYWANAFYQKTTHIEQLLGTSDDTTFPFSTGNQTKIRGTPNLARLLPLWFAGLGLLENFITVPSKVTNSRSCAILKVLRAQHGLSVESHGVGGLDEALRSDRVDLIDIGFDLLGKAGINRPRQILELLQTSENPFAQELIPLAVRPDKYTGVLVGLSCTFAELHLIMVPFVSQDLQVVLQDIALRERRGLEEWLALREKDSDGSDVCRAYGVGMRELATCFN